MIHFALAQNHLCGFTLRVRRLFNTEPKFFTSRGGGEKSEERGKAEFSIITGIKVLGVADALLQTSFGLFFNPASFQYNPDSKPFQRRLFTVTV